MRTFEQWMDEYNVSHQNKTNQAIHKICVPLIMFSVLGFLWAIPSPGGVSLWLNWATLFVLLCSVFYLSLNFWMFIGMLVQAAIMLTVVHSLSKAGILLQVCVVIFVLSWIAQFIGHKIEGKKPSFLQDLAFLLIGPLWVLRFFYNKIGIKV
jgi:uncharacterized membrane protein YGL010W